MKPREITLKMWQELGDIPINEEEEIDQDFYHFKKGTPREDIWHWFEEIDQNFSVGEVMSVRETKGMEEKEYYAVYAVIVSAKDEDEALEKAMETVKQKMGVWDIEEND